MCEGAIPGDEIHALKTCPSCGADLSQLVRQRLAALTPVTPPPQASPFIAQAALFSLLAPCFSIALNLLGRGAVSGSRVGALVIGIVCSLFIVAGFILGVMAFFAPKEAGDGTLGKAIAGICINGLLISFAVLSFFTYQKVAASENTAPDPHKSWSYISGR